MTFSCVNGMSRACVHGIFCPVVSVDGHVILKSANYEELIEPRTKKKRYGPRTFRVGEPTTWKLEQYTKTLAYRIPMTRGQFVLELRTFLFARADSSAVLLRTVV